MSNLSDYIKQHPETPLSRWAQEFGVSRPHLYSLIDGTRNPSLPVAQRIALATSGAVPLEAWPNIAAVLTAARGDA